MMQRQEHRDPDRQVSSMLYTGRNVGMRAWHALYDHEPRDWTFRDVAKRFSVTGFYQLEGVGYKTFEWMDSQLKMRGLDWKGQA